MTDREINIDNQGIFIDRITHFNIIINYDTTNISTINFLLENLDIDIDFRFGLLDFYNENTFRLFCQSLIKYN